MVTTFCICFLVALLICLLAVGYARHLGNPEPTDWKAILLISVVVGAGGAGVIAVLQEVARLVWSVLL